MNKRILTLLMSFVLCIGLVGTAFADISVGTDPTTGKTDIVRPSTGGTTTPTPPPYTPPAGGYTPSTPSNPSYSVGDNKGTTDNGSWNCDKTSAKKGDTVTITVKPNEGYQGTPTVKDKNGNIVSVTDKGDGKWSFVMPDGVVTVSVEFTPVNPFTDVEPGAYYADAVAWAVAKGITTGKTDTTFAPNDPCTRAQIVTFLWRTMGSPEVEANSTFSDVAAGSYYEKAVAWAVSKGITQGTGDGKFSPNQPCTRAQAVTFLHRAENTPAASGSSFNDVAGGSYYAGAVAWAVANEITNGTGNGNFSPNNTCNRAQIVTFLYRDMA